MQRTLSINGQTHHTKTTETADQTIGGTAEEKGRKKRPTITNIHEGQLYINGQWLAVDPPMKRPSRSEMRKEAWHDIWQGINESMLAFFNTCLGELVLLCLVCALISGFIVLILKLTGNL